MRTIDRKVEIPHEGPFCDIMWSDPEDIDNWSLSNRGAGFIFKKRMAIWSKSCLIDTLVISDRGLNFLGIGDRDLDRLLFL
jgi:diadenosine tetraphosphatase ApaH/serine/threonine PP2A family protein phosphatase